MGVQGDFYGHPCTPITCILSKTYNTLHQIAFLKIRCLRDHFRVFKVGRKKRLSRPNQTMKQLYITAERNNIQLFSTLDIVQE